jgi:hypothetical protein
MFWRVASLLFSGSLGTSDFSPLSKSFHQIASSLLGTFGCFHHTPAAQQRCDVQYILPVPYLYILIHSLVLKLPTSCLLNFSTYFIQLDQT